MAAEPGLSLLESGDHEEDEDEIEQRRIRDELLDKQLQGAFDDGSSDDGDILPSSEEESEDEAMGGRGDADQHGQQILKKIRDPNPFELFFPKNTTNDESESFIISNKSVKDTYTQTVNSKEEIDKLQNEVLSLKQTILTLEKDKTKKDELLELSKVQNGDLEQTIALMERCDPNKKIVKQTEITIKNLKNSYQQEVHQLQQQLKSLNKKLEKKEEECSIFEKKLAELQRTHDLLIVDKTHTINQMTRSLENSQAQCHQLIADNVTADNIRLQTQLEEAAREKEQLHLTVKNLQEQLNRTMAELRLFQDIEEKNHDKAEEIAVLKAEVAELRKAKAVVDKEKLKVQGKLDDLMKRFEADKRQEISDYNKEYLRFPDEALVKIRKEVEEEADLKIKEYSIRLDQSLREMNEVKEMYISVCETKEKLVLSLDKVSAEFQQVIVERDRLAEQLRNNNELRDQLARRLNEMTVNTVDGETLQKLVKERDSLQAELERCEKIKNQLSGKVNNLKKENNELSAEIERIKSLRYNSPNENDTQLDAECTRLQEELSAMSARHTLELSSVHKELQGARDRVMQLEKAARLQIETEIKSLQQDRDLLKTKCDEKEVQIKKLIESRKRPPVMVSVATETEVTEELRKDMAELCQLEERHRRELIRCREEYKNALVIMEQAHQEELVTASNKNKEIIDILQEKHHQILEAVSVQLEQRELTMRDAHRRELLAVEERTKEMTVKYFAEKVKDLEAKFSEKASSRVDPTIVESLHKTLMDKTKEIKNIQGELKLKEAIIDDQRVNLEKAKSAAKRYRSKLIKTNQEIVLQSKRKCEEYKAEMIRTIEEREKEVFEKIRKLEQIYEEREKELKKIIMKRQHVR